jgi:hypothetical protein
MNERIRELAKQSLPEFYLTNCPSALEKFAELIVRECGVALSPMLRDMVSRGQAYNLIKEHFGVEE